jgi:site-specific DNA recombinase
MRAALYARFSTDQQREASIADQFRSCERTAKDAGLTVTHKFEDRGISAGTSERWGYQEMLKAARAKLFDVIVVEDISRLWRNRSEYGQRSAEFEDIGVHIVTCVGDDTRRDGYGLVLGIKQALAEHARKEISYRTRRGLEGKALAGGSTGGRCFGYRSATEVDDAQAALVIWIFEQSAAGISVRTIAQALNERLERAPLGGIWRPSTISAILRNRRYLGEVIYGRTRVKTSAADSRRISREPQPQPLVNRIDRNLQIVPAELYRRVQAQLKTACRTKRPDVSSSPARI